MRNGRYFFYIDFFLEILLYIIKNILQSYMHFADGGGQGNL